VNQIRTVSDDCPLDAGGRIVHWLSGVRPTDSVALLATFLEAAEPRRLTDAALAALAMHAEPAALERLAAASRSGATGAIRGQALFWLAQRAGDKTGGVITDAIARDPDTEVKRRAVFALSQLPADQGVPLLIQVARTQANPVVRRQAIFWLGQSKDARALAFIEEILFGK
jgi:HEAT repeat protein